MSCVSISRIATILGHLESALDTPFRGNTLPNSTTVERVSEIERNFILPRVPTPRVQFTPLLFGIDGSIDFYFDTRGVRGVVTISKAGEVIKYSSTIADIKSLVEQEFQKILSAFKRPQASL